MPNPDAHIQKICPLIKDLSLLSEEQIQKLAEYIREYLKIVVQHNGGHLSSNLGVVDVIIALYRSFNFPIDNIIFDVSHQSYVHKILSDRLESFPSMRKKNGLSGYTHYKESPFDMSHVAHAGVGISTGLGLHQSKVMVGDNSFTIIFVGDAAIANGVSFEALNHISSLSASRFIIILNDNQMSISKAVGSLSNTLTKIISHPLYNRSRKKVKNLLKKFGNNPNRFIGNFLMRLKNMVLHNYFEEFGLRYIGPVDGHNHHMMKKVFDNIVTQKQKIDKPIIIHTITIKGKGDSQAENKPEETHGISPKITPDNNQQVSVSFSSVLEKTLPALQKKYHNITATTAAMTKGTGLGKFSQEYPKRFFDVGIAESHAVAFSSFLNKTGKFKPFIAIYSTFLQRALDQIFHDVALQNLAPVFVLDRAGLVGEDGATHHGLYDIAYLKAIPNIIIASPSGYEEFEALLDFAYHQTQAIFIRIPRAIAEHHIPVEPILLGKSSWVEKYPHAKATIIVYGSMLTQVLEIKNSLPTMNIINLRFVKPLDTQILQQANQLTLPIITIEEHALIGGAGESIKAYLAEIGPKAPVLSLGVLDQFIEHASREDQLEECFLSGEPLKQKILKFLNQE